MVRLILILILSLSLYSANEGEWGVMENNGRKEIIVHDPFKPSTRSGDLIRLFQNATKLEAFFYDDYISHLKK